MYYPILEISLQAQERSRAAQASIRKGNIIQPSLLRALARAYGMPYLALGVIKLVNDLLNFAGECVLVRVRV
jgi:hypothetical protein